MSTVFLTGVSGFLGWHLAQELKKKHKIIGTYFSHPVETGGAKIIPLNLRDATAVSRIIQKYHPEVILHTAALTDVRFCQSNPRIAEETNTGATRILAEESRKKSLRLIYLSTDRVFDGEKGDYTEEDIPSPIDHYGKTKLEGEKAVSETVAAHLIVRLPLMFGPPSPAHASFIGWMLEAFRNNRPLELFTDQFRTPLYSEDACAAVEILLSQPEIKGLFHLGGRDRVSRDEFGRKMAAVFGFDPSLIRPLPMAAKPHQPPSPPDVSLNSEKLFRAIGFRARPLEDGLAALKKRLNDSIP